MYYGPIDDAPLQARTHDFQINIIGQSNKPISSNQFLGWSETIFLNFLKPWW